MGSRKERRVLSILLRPLLERNFRHFGGYNYKCSIIINVKVKVPLELALEFNNNDTYLRENSKKNNQLDHLTRKSLL